MPKTQVIIVGAGAAGLSCALRLRERNIPFRILEASDHPGGRIRTDHVNGFLLDRGFQVLLTAYPESKRLLNYQELGLHSFKPGALVYTEGALHRVADPVRALPEAISGAFSPVGTMADKLRVLKLRNRVTSGPLESVLNRPERATIDQLRRDGFSNQMIDRFFRPFLSGIFLETELETSSRKFEFVFRMFSEGTAALPVNGMQAIPEQMAARLPPDSIDYETPVTSIDGTAVTTARGDRHQASSVVIAVGQPEAMKLLGRTAEIRGLGTVCVYFDAPQSPVRGPWLVLNGEDNGTVNHLCVPGNVSSSYCPNGRALVSANIVGNPAITDETLEALVRRQMDQWFGSTADWKHLRTYRIPWALPAQSSGALSAAAQPERLSERVVLCGDYMDIASINGAMLSGRRAADSIAD